MVFGVGPAGTGKTYLAVAMAISALLNKQVNRIILARPAVEAGERLGFLPGTLQEKIDPYLRPLYDALFDMMDPERVERYLEKNVIEIAPIAFMRGRTLNDSFVILDEAQNTTSEQMKMFVTRLGFGSKAVITGDVTQIDLPNARRSGLIEAVDILQGVNGISFVHFDESDVVRHHLVQRIIRAYDEHKTRQTEQQLSLLEPKPARSQALPEEPPLRN
jgi:phosphate starvation-inducible PhoH-like protein